MIQSRICPVQGSDFPVEWIPHQKFACFALNVTHIVLPPGELWFCRLFNQALPHVQDEALRQDVKGFIAQEGAHARAHRNILGDFERQGWDFSVSRARLDRIFNGLLGDKVLGRWAAGRWQFRWLRARIGLVAAIEHLTCVLGNWILANEAIAQAGADPRMLALLRWHGEEEVEHRSVAHDLYLHLGGGYLGRSLWFLVALFGILLTWKRGTQVFIRQDVGGPRCYGFKTYIRVSRAGYLPRVSYLIRSTLRYFNWRYHPESEVGFQ